MLERMDSFFNSRADSYDRTALEETESANEFYKFTALQLPKKAGARVLDLGCGTGLELEYLYAINPEAAVTGIDLSQGMLDKMKSKFPDKKLRAVRGSFFDIIFGITAFDCIVSVEALHHYTLRSKSALYRRVRQALKHGGYFILTDTFADSELEERKNFDDLDRLRHEESMGYDVICHYDTPLTLEHELEALRNANFSKVEVLKSWGAVSTIKAEL